MTLDSLHPGRGNPLNTKKRRFGRDTPESRKIQKLVDSEDKCAINKMTPHKDQMENKCNISSGSTPTARFRAPNIGAARPLSPSEERDLPRHNQKYDFLT